LWQPLADIYFYRRDYPRAKELIEKGLVAESREDQVNARLRLAHYYADQGKFASAIEPAREAKKFASQAGGSLGLVLASQLALAVALDQQGDEAEMRGQLRQAAKETRELLAIDHEGSELLPLPLLTLVAKLDVRRGTVDTAEYLLSQTTPMTAGHAIWESYTKMLAAELSSAEGRYDLAATQIKDAFASAETFQAHESMARVHEHLGDTVAAITEYEWLVRNRGRAIVECLQGSCQMPSIVDWNLAHYRLARLYEAQGRAEDAVEYYQRFLGLWENAEGLEVCDDARRRAVALQGMPQTPMPASQ
jgi:tetratricopeptide (TPR) repeat protein